MLAALRRKLHFWFGLSELVDRRSYFRDGLALMVFKYLVDAAVIHAVTGKWWTPTAYLVPSMQLRDRVSNLPNWLDVAMILWTLPFLWIGVSMTLRRAVDAGRSAWTGLLFFVPIMNYLVMILLSLAPTSTPDVWTREPAPTEVDDRIRAALLGIVVSLAVALPLAALQIFVLRGYGMGLFFGAPFLLGAVSAYIFNRDAPRGLRETLLVVLVAHVLAGGALLLFAIEGMACLFMALPFALVIGWMGGVIGREIALRAPRPATFTPGMLIVLLPALVPPAHPVGARPDVVPVYVVVSSIDVAAPPERVWRHVVAFSELPPPTEWLFRTGVAYPLRARIAGTGVGAVRRCEFSTGAFVEPITRWEPPARLGFDVLEQPLPMTEWSPWPRVQAPHLNGGFRAVRGEFRMVPLATGGTRLEGRTWYALDLWPRAYWRLWAEPIVGAIHHRVLAHVRTLVEKHPHGMVLKDGFVRGS